MFLGSNARPEKKGFMLHMSVVVEELFLAKL